MRRVYVVGYSGNESSDPAQAIFGTRARARASCKARGYTQKHSRDSTPNVEFWHRPREDDEWLTIVERIVR